MSKIVDLHKRLAQACADNPRIPKLHEGLYPYIGERIGASNEAVRKWFSGDARPRNDKLEPLAKLIGCDPVWLATGVAPELSKQEMREWHAKAHGAVNVVTGMMEMAGAACGTPGPDDPSADDVHLFVTLRGRVIRYHVTTARNVDGKWVFPVPHSTKGLSVIGVIPENPFAPVLLDMPTDQIEANRSKRAGGYDVVVEKSRAEYKTGEHRWSRFSAL